MLSPRSFLPFVPALLLIGGAILLQSLLREAAPSLRALAKPLPLLGFALALGLSFHFNRSRLFFAALSLTLVYLVFVWVLPALKLQQQQQLYVLTAFLLPLNLIIFSAIGERGMLNVRGMKRFAFLLAQVLLVLGIYQSQAQGLTAYFQTVFLSSPLLSATPVPQPALLVMLMGLVLFALILVLQVSAEDIAFLGILVITGLLMHQAGSATGSLALFTSAGLLIAVAVVQESYSMAYIDELTGLPGRRALQEQLNKLGSQYSIAMLDVDHFKKFNDSYGHDVGDQVLRRVAACMREVSAGGKPYRYGGEEFSIIFPSKSKLEVLGALEAVRESIASHPFDIRREGRRQNDKKDKGKSDNKKVQVTISIGVADVVDETTGPWDVMKAADQALYRAKKAGRNQVSQ